MDIDATEPQGNAFSIMGLVRQLLKDSGRFHEWPEVQKRMMAGDYDNLCDVAEEVTFCLIRVVNRPKAKRGKDHER